jgi:hypothetical protein
MQGRETGVGATCRVEEPHIFFWKSKDRVFVHYATRSGNSEQ